MTNRRQPFIINLLQMLSKHSGPIACPVNYVSQSVWMSCICLDVVHPFSKCICWFLQRLILGIRSYVGILALPFRPEVAGVKLV